VRCVYSKETRLTWECWSTRPWCDELAPAAVVTPLSPCCLATTSLAARTAAHSNTRITQAPFTRYNLLSNRLSNRLVTVNVFLFLSRFLRFLTFFIFGQNVFHLCFNSSKYSWPLLNCSLICPSQFCFATFGWFHNSIQRNGFTTEELLPAVILTHPCRAYERHECLNTQKCLCGRVFVPDTAAGAAYSATSDLRGRHAAGKGHETIRWKRKEKKGDRKEGLVPREIVTRKVVAYAFILVRQGGMVHCTLKAKFHYAIWFEADSKLVADLQRAEIWPVI